MRLRAASAWGGPAESELVAGLGLWQFWEPCMKKPEKPPDPTGKGCPHRESSAALTPALGASVLAGHALPKEDTLPVGPGPGRRPLAQLCCRPGLRVDWGPALARAPPQQPQQGFRNRGAGSVAYRVADGCVLGRLLGLGVRLGTGATWAPSGCGLGGHWAPGGREAGTGELSG